MEDCQQERWVVVAFNHAGILQIPALDCQVDKPRKIGKLLLILAPAIRGKAMIGLPELHLYNWEPL
jgi:hypothetical protein